MTETNAKPPHLDLPPGTVIGPDGKPCKVCTGADWRSWSKIPKGSTKSSSASSQSAGAGGSGALGAAAVASTSASSPSDNCPVNIEQLGRATWTFLHTAAAYYPTEPLPAHKSSMLALLTSLPLTYPCHHCASHLGENLQAHPPDVSNRSALSRWLCERHNDVNVRLSKPTFDCNKTDERWRDGPADGSCD